ncbi:hypothetical protein GQ457_09G014740 [Hibiscus cannabinus]
MTQSSSTLKRDWCVNHSEEAVAKPPLLRDRHRRRHRNRHRLVNLATATTRRAVEPNAVETISKLRRGPFFFSRSFRPPSWSVCRAFTTSKYLVSRGAEPSSCLLLSEPFSPRRSPARSFIICLGIHRFGLKANTS